ncbi:hypothetical protein ACNKHS_00840 [Shigella flexneri]
MHGQFEVHALTLTWASRALRHPYKGGRNHETGELLATFEPKPTC